MNAEEKAAREAAICAQLRDEIEALCGDIPPLHSQTAYTPRMTFHVSISNGARKEQGEDAAPAGSILQMAAQSYDVAKQMREAIEGRAYLVWRAEPEMLDGGLWMRLCFESLPPEEEPQPA